MDRYFKVYWFLNNFTPLIPIPLKQGWETRIILIEWFSWKISKFSSGFRFSSFWKKKSNIYVLFTRQQTFCKKNFFKILSVKKNFFWRGRNMKMVKIGTNRYKFTRFFVKYMFLPLQNIFLLKKFFFLRSCENKTSTCEHPFKNALI
jgi:hypothetical protein